MEYVCYVLYSAKYDKIYIGFSGDLIDRFKSHNSLATKGYTIAFRPWEVIHVEFFALQSAAKRREKQLKSSQGRKQIKEEFIPRHIGLTIEA
jgi:putative endonuclease